MPRPATFENAIAFAQDLIRIPSPSGEEAEVASRVRTELEVLGFEDVRADRWGNVLGVVPGAGEAPSVLLNAHLDVVHEGDPAEWEYPPFDGVIADGQLHGRGAMDIKGPLAIQVYAAASLLGREAPGDVIVAFTVQEERGGMGFHRLLESGAVTPGAVVLGEATHGDVTLGHRGRAELEVVIHGLAGHASAPDRARNALDLVGPVLDGIRDLQGRQSTDPVLGPGTVVATAIDVSPETRNVIPDRVVVVVDWRVLPAETPDGAVERLDSSVRARIGELPEGFSVETRVNTEYQESYTGIGEERALFAPGFLMEYDDPVIVAASRAVGRRDDPAVPATIRPWTFATDGGWSCGLLGIPTLGFAPGEEAHAHTNMERLALDEAEWALHRYPELVVAVQQALKQPAG